jgi:hypothetical protein
MKEPFDYSIVPYTFGLCAAEECPRATTCLRHIALEYAPADRVINGIPFYTRIWTETKEGAGSEGTYVEDEKCL